MQIVYGMGRGKFRVNGIQGMGYSYGGMLCAKYFGKGVGFIIAPQGGWGRGLMRIG
jgi:hypothetical protein